LQIQNKRGGLVGGHFMNSTQRDTGAWLETAKGERLPVSRNCGIGRSRDNQVVLKDPRVSRLHALIRMQGYGEFWLVDFGTVNGTRLDGRRIAVPTRLHDGARVEIGGVPFVFRHPLDPADREPHPSGTEVTEHDIRQLPMWLLVVDIVGSTLLYRSVPSDELPAVIGPWFATCRDLMEASGGTINQYLGDGFFGHWADGEGVCERLCETLGRLVQLQKSQPPSFRWVLHHGRVTAAGGLTPGEENLMGQEIHFVFRMEGVAKELGESGLVSGSAAQGLSRLCRLREVGICLVKGFEGEHRFYAWEGEPGGD
jgi:adenylate cyclase